MSDAFPEFSLWDHVVKDDGDYRFEGQVVGIIRKLSGRVRYVVENRDGILHIFSEKNLKVKP